MSGVILATAIGGGLAAGTVTTGAVVAAGIGAGTTLYGGAKSFSDASKARKRGQAAERDALKAIEEAKRKIDINRMEQLSISKEPYELMREAELVQGAMGMQAGVEGQTRGAAATAGRVQMAQQASQSEVRSQMAERLDEINKLVALEDKRIDQQLSGIALDEAAGAQQAIRDAEKDRAAYLTQGFGTLGSIAQGISENYAAGNFGRIKARGLAAESENVGELLAGLDAFGMPTTREQRQANRQMQDNMVDFPQPMTRQQERQLERQGRQATNDIQRAQAQAAIDPAFGGPVIAQDRTFNPNFSPLGTSARPDQYAAPGQAMSPQQTERMLMAQRRLGQQEARDIQRAIRRNPELLNYQAGGQGTSGPLDPFDPFGGGGFTPPSSTEAAPREAVAAVAPAGLGGEPAPAPPPERRPVPPRDSVTSSDRNIARGRLAENLRQNSGLEGAELASAIESIEVQRGDDGKFTATYTPVTKQQAELQVQSESARELLDRLAEPIPREIAEPNPTPQQVEVANTEALERAAEVGPAAEEVVRSATDNVNASNPLPIAMQWLNVREPNYRELDPATGDSIDVATPTITPEGKKLLTEIWAGVGHGERAQQDYIKKENAWCAGFVNKVLADSNLTLLPGGVQKQRADMYLSAKFGENVYTNEQVKRSNLHQDLKDKPEAYGFPKPQGKVTDAKMGDVVIINRPDNKPPTRHVGFFAGYDGDGKIKILGGNQNDEVNVTVFNTSDVFGIRRINQPDLTDKELEAVSNIVTRQDASTR